jgi:COMPASS component SWD1
VRFEAPVYIAELHPYNQSVPLKLVAGFAILTRIFLSFLFVASLFEDQPVLVDISSPRPIKHVLPSQPQADEPSSDPPAKERKQSTCVTIFTALGNHILAGTSAGYFNIIETESRKIIHNSKHSIGNTMIVLLRLASNGRDILSNSTDRIIRTLHVDPDLSSVDLNPDVIRLEVEHKFQDIVNRLSWNHVAFSGATGEYVAASTYMNHDVYVWERSQGSLVKILEGPKEELGVLEWHPTRPLVAACGLESGCIYQWSIVAPQKWSALAPDFVEVEENVEYVELEDEFDVQDAEEVHKRRLDLEDEEIDVLTIEPVKGEEEEQDTFRMPLLLDLGDSESEEEVVAVGPGTMRRKSPGAGREWVDDGKVDSGAEDRKANGTAGGRGQSRAKKRTQRGDEK